ncbi:hypothetical protein [Candidatus Pelagibacter communis]|uniref:hypothetical protein n=1 Tax=Pelagibacter ubique TaxID=198252 RepID=UPI00094BFD7B|nr:hypothetical protein [Candidatus Pelagibacter ubique]ONI47622.1 hypothetical protein AN644_04565 [Epulopiscium sp. SCG-C06WGA-EpuloA1]
MYVDNDMDFLRERSEYVKEAQDLFLAISIEAYKSKRLKRIFMASVKQGLRFEERFESIIKKYDIKPSEFLPITEEE